jgi:hypothetical protein
VGVGEAGERGRRAQVLERGGRQEPAFAPLLDEPAHPLALRRRAEVDVRLTWRQRARVHVHELSQALGRPVGDAGDDHAGVAVPGQHDVVQVRVGHRVEDVGDVRVEVHVGTGQVDPVAQAGEGHRVHFVPAFPQRARHFAPRPRAEPGPSDEYVRCHASSVGAPT